MERPVWDRIQEIYHLTLPMPESERSAFMANACDGDPVLIREVTSLLKADDSLDGFLESSVFELGLKLFSRDSAKSSDGLIGTTIENRFLVERVLGHGGMGKVYLARDQSLHNKAVVIKVLLDAALNDPYVVKKFRQEVEALARIAHPNVVNVLGHNKLPDGTLYIVMQYVNGVTLRSAIPVEGMDLKRAGLILKQVGAALEFVHQEKIFHRDLKPDNIMLQSLNGVEHVTVVDFGIAKVKDSVVASSTSGKVSVGTVLYMSPEQLRGGQRITAASDIYSMGVMAYEMVTGRPPFIPASAPQLLELQSRGVRVKPIDLRPSLPIRAQTIILRALSFDPTVRYQSAAEFGDSLARALLHEEEPGSSSRTHDRQFRLGKLQFAIISGFLVVLLGVLVVLWILNKTTAPKDANAANPPTATETPSLPTHSFIYSLTVQRMRNRRAFQAAFQSNGNDIFDSGDRFQLNVMSNNPGYVYVFNEGTPGPGVSSFTIIYPVPSVNNGSASVGANQWARTNWNTFGGEPGTENLWLVWSTASVAELESGKTGAFNNNGRLTGPSLDTVKAFLKAKQEESKAKINRDKVTQQTTVRGVGDVVVRMVELQHR
ncbi:MAG TPA: protein kinase [Pyrinomonadaceae bacterium]|nr:protein kinase [Pyrinomonadaceae bacterium]